MSKLKLFHTSRYFWRPVKTFANSLDLDQDRQNLGPPFGTESVPEIFFLKKLILKVSNEKLPIMQSLDPEQ